MRIEFWATLQAVTLGLLWGLVHTAQASGPADCQRLAERTVNDYTILSAEYTAESEAQPAACRVLGVLPPEIVFQVVLPSDWSGRILMTGNGGYAGQRPDSPQRVRRAMQLAADGFVAVSTNTGHDSRNEPLATFALNDRQKEIDYSFRAVHLSIVTAKELTALYYGRSHDYAYWQGCSTGGRQGLMSAQRFPRDFDGVVAGAPVLNFTDTQIWGAWNAQALSEGPISTEQIGLVAKTVYDRCDSRDGVRDGLLEDPRTCDFDPARDLPRCQDDGKDGCFDEPQVEALQKIYGGVVSRGEVLFPGLPVGAEAAPPSGRRRTTGWAGWILSPDGPSRQFVFAETFMRYLAFEPDEPEFDLRAFDYDEDPHRMDFIRSILDATDPDLTRFRDAGGKLLMYFGWADTALNPNMGVDYYESAMAVTGEGTRDFFRLFMVPGMFHCGGGLGASRAEYLTPLMNWVEGGEAPKRIEVARVVEGNTEMTRPICPYPEAAQYDGSGDTNDAASFACAPPTDR